MMQERELVGGMAVFVAVARSGSFSAAARASGLTASAVSKTIARLEEGFGTRLVARSTRRMSLTEAGQTFFERASSLLADLRAVDQEMSSRGSALSGRLRVSAPLLFGQALVAPALFSFMKKAPGVTLDLDLSDRFVDMVEERVDVAVRITAEPPPAFIARRAGEIRRVLCASPAYLRKNSRPRKPADLSGHACLLAPYQSPQTWEFPETSDTPAQRVRIDARLRLSSTMTLYEAAKAGLGIADLPRYLVRDDLHARRLVSVLESYQTRPSSVFVIYAAGTLVPARTRAVADHLVRELTSSLAQQ